jgi:membrane protein DedA with SNARE-associated domain
MTLSPVTNTNETLLCKIERAALDRVVKPLCDFLLMSPGELRRAAAFPTILIALFCLFLLLWKILRLPPPEELIRTIDSAFSTHGYWLVFISAFIEGLLLIGAQFPGSVVLVLAMMASRRGILNPLAVGTLIIAGFFVACMINYALGRFGWYRLFARLGLDHVLDRMRTRVEERGLSVVRYTYFHPNISSLTATSCGILRVPFGAFSRHSLIALVAWNIAWASAIYVLGEWLRQFLNWWPVIIGLTLFLCYRVAKVTIRRRFGGSK